MSEPLIKWENPSPDIWTATIKVHSLTAEAWVRHWNGRAVKTPGGVGRIVECSPSEADRTVGIKVRIGPNL